MDTVRCPGCGEENPSRFRLCGFCGTSLAPPEAVACPSCGEENPGKFRLCGFCGTPLQGAAPAPGAPGAAAPAYSAPAPPSVPPPIAAPLPPQEVRKIVTIVFSDLKGSTALTESIDAEAINEVKERYFASMAAEIVRHGGKIEKYIGDAIMAVFGLPRAHEDDALRAVRAAHGMTLALHRLNLELRQFYGVEIAARTGVNTGEVVANIDPGAEQRLATGDAVNVAARLEQAAPANEVLIGEVTYSLVRAQVEVEAVEPLELKGKTERVPAYRLIAVRDAATELPQIAQHTALVGRTTELEQLRRDLREVVGRGGCRLVTVMGEAGVGKSHLVDTFLGEVAASATVLRGRCLPYGDGITFWPIVEVARHAAGIAEDDSPEGARAKLAALLTGVTGADEIVDRLASVIGLSPARYPVAEVFWGARKFLEALATGRPVVVVVEDIHDAEPTFLELLEHLLETTARQAAVLVVSTARESLLEEHPDWATRPGSSRVSLAPLAADESGRLVEVLLGGRVALGVRERIVTAAEGNPLFVEQLVSMLVDKGMLRKDDAGWVSAGDLADLAVPPTIQALLAARLDDLSREERAVVEPAAVIGLVFMQPAVAELVPVTLRGAVPGHLSALDRKQFLHRESSAAGEDEMYRFRNLLIRDATYGSLLKRARAQLHERFVTWAERVNRERNREQEFEEILGYHLEQAYRYRTELGPIDAEGRSIAGRAAEKLGAAGRRAFARGDLPAAASLLRRTVDLLEPNDPAHIDTQAELGEVLLEAGEFAEATTVLEAAIAGADAIGDAPLHARGRLGRLGIALYAEELESGAAGRALDEASAAAALFEGLGDDAGLARAWRLIGSIHATAGRYEQAAEAAQRVVEHATRAGDRRLASRAAAGYATIARAGATPADEVAARCGPLLDQVAGDRKAEAIILAVIAVAEAMRQRFDRARELRERARTILFELGPSVTASSTSIEGSVIETLAGDHAAARALLEADSRQLEGMGERYFRSTIVALLAHALVAEGALDEAAVQVELAMELADADDTESQILWRTAKATLLAATGRSAEAAELARAAVDLAATTDHVDLQGETSAHLGDVLVAAGNATEAVESYRTAIALHDRKGNAAAAARVRTALEATLAREPAG
jgi:class 3 adenylate cyclase/tetratricopeptide (TPR) repeat protein